MADCQPLARLFLSRKISFSRRCNVYFYLLAFLASYFTWGFPERLSNEALAPLGWISILSGTIYMSWMAIYYANMMSMTSEIEREAESHRETARRLKAAKDMADAASRAKSIFLAKMSHELRTPLNAVIGFSEVLLEDAETSGRYDSKKADLKRIDAAGKHLLSLVTDVLDLSKIESNLVELKTEEFDLTGVIRELVGSVEPAISKNKNKLIVRFADDLGIVRTDPTKLRQVVLNLLSNAAKFTEGGLITLSVYRRKGPAGDWIEIEVHDTGIGISNGDLANLFENFHQADRATSTKYGGAGLGLALTQKLCGLMGGGIAVTIEMGRGSTFKIQMLAWIDDDSRSKGDALSIASPKLAVAI